MRTGTAPMSPDPSDHDGSAPANPAGAGPSDRELMAEVKEGDLARLGELFERHQGRLLHFFLRLTRDRAGAEDLVQEVFVRILKYRGTYQSDAEFTPWMFRLARNAATDLWRARPKELAHEPDAPEPAAEVEHPVETMEQDDRRRRLARALGSLPEEKRELLLLARFSEMRYDEIGELLGITVGAVKLRVHRAMKELKVAFDSIATAGGSAAREEMS
ncbi:MAG: RNA polymerase sigma factor [Thermoanaerobaculia bacterium]